MVGNFRPRCPPRNFYLRFWGSGVCPARGCRMWTKLLPEAGGCNLMFLAEAAGGGQKSCRSRASRRSKPDIMASRSTTAVGCTHMANPPPLSALLTITTPHTAGGHNPRVAAPNPPESAVPAIPLHRPCLRNGNLLSYRWRHWARVINFGLHCQGNAQHNRTGLCTLLWWHHHSLQSRLQPRLNVQKRGRESHPSVVVKEEEGRHSRGQKRQSPNAHPSPLPFGSGNVYDCT